MSHFPPSTLLHLLLDLVLPASHTNHCQPPYKLLPVLTARPYKALPGTAPGSVQSTASRRGAQRMAEQLEDVDLNASAEIEAKRGTLDELDEAALAAAR